MNILRPLSAVAIAAGLAACTNGNGAVEPPITSVSVGSSSYSHLQFAVGTANIAGQIGLNTVVTLRQPNGLSAVGYSTPSITWDGAFTNTGPSAQSGLDSGLKQITGLLPPNPVPLNNPPAGTFGTGSNSWGAFGYGFDDANTGPGSGATGLVNNPCLPFFASTLLAPNLSVGTPACGGGGAQFLGGPPAFPNLRDAALAGEIGSFLGFTPFAGLTPAPNPATGKSTFTLSIAIPTSPVTTLPPVTATMSSFGGLPAFATPILTPDAAGTGGSIAYVLPAGVTEALLIVYNWGPNGTGGGNCNYGAVSGEPYVYSILVTPASPNPVTLADNLGPTPSLGSLPAGESTHTFCTSTDNGGSGADQYQVVGVGFDYPAFEAGYPQSNGNPTPTIVGANGQADVTISDLSGLNVATPGVPSVSVRRSR